MMQARLVPEFSEKEVRKYWHSIDAPIELVRMSNRLGIPGEYSIVKRQGRKSDEANIFVLQSTKLDPLVRDSLIRKAMICVKQRGDTFNVDINIPSHMEVLSFVRGAFL